MIDLPVIHLQTLKKILAAQIPNYQVVAFGSRVNGNPKPYSDIDLAVISKGTLEKSKLWELKEAFEESDLPYRVDVLDWDRLSVVFRENIKGSCETLQI